MTLDAEITLAQGDFVLNAAFGAPPGITAIFGPSGSGKSTLLMAIAGLKKSRGRLILGDRDLSSIPAHRRNVGLVFQDARLFPHLTVRQNLAYARKRATAPRDLEETARFFDIAALLDRPVANLSGGEKGRVALARALVAAPELLLLDEPFAALDGVLRRAFIAVLRDMNHVFNLSMLVVTHDIEDACALADHVVGLKDGRVAATGPFAETVRQPAFQALLDPRDVGAALPAQKIVSSFSQSDQAFWLRADQVMIAARRPEALSARNIIEGRIVSIVAEEAGSRLVSLETSSGFILSRLTPASIESLALAQGMPVWAVFKAHAI